MNNRKYAQADHEPPRPGTLFARIISNTSSEAFSSMDEICRRVATKKTTVNTVVGIAVTRGYIERSGQAWAQPQSYRLTTVGRRLKQAYGD